MAKGERMVRFFHVIGIAFAILLLLLTIDRYKKQRLSGTSAMLWGIVCTGMIAGILSFEYWRPVLDRLNVRVFDFFVLVALFVLIFFQFSQYAIVKDNQRQIQEVVYSLAIKQGRKKLGKK